LTYAARELETTEMTTCFELVTLDALLEAEALLASMDLAELAARSHRILRRLPELYADVTEEGHTDDDRRSAARQLVRLREAG
jgi:hypothetical protein